MGSCSTCIRPLVLARSFWGSGVGRRHSGGRAGDPGGRDGPRSRDGGGLKSDLAAWKTGGTPVPATRCSVSAPATRPGIKPPKPYGAHQRGITLAHTIVANAEIAIVLARGENRYDKRGKDEEGEPALVVGGGSGVAPSARVCSPGTTHGAIAARKPDKPVLIDLAARFGLTDYASDAAHTVAVTRVFESFLRQNSVAQHSWRWRWRARSCSVGCAARCPGRAFGRAQRGSRQQSRVSRRSRRRLAPTGSSTWPVPNRR